MAAIVANIGCQSPRAGDAMEPGASTRASGRPSRRSSADNITIRRVVCLYDQRPWLSIDSAGDANPEGIRFRVFLDPGTGRGVPRDGTFHVELYQLVRGGPDAIERRLVSDWHYPTSDFQPVKSNLLGMGYHMRLRWAAKKLAGADIEIVTTFEDTAGRTVRSGTKRLRIPDYRG